MANKKSDSGFAESPTARTSKRIAYFLIVVYGFLLAGVFFVSWTINADTNFWTELFKAGFLLLGGALTTIIGYFFGSRAIQEAEDSAKKAILEASAARVAADSLQLEVDRLTNELMTPVTTEDEMQIADEFAEEGN
jgi:hypothetical protein